MTSPSPQVFSHKGSAYTLVEGPTRLEAETRAQSLGGNLVSINDQEENQFLRDSFNFFNPDTVPSDYQNQVDYAQSFWVGMEYVDQAWTWADGTTPESNGFSNWIPGDPDYLDREIYAKISPDATGRWANATNNDVTFSERPNVFYGIVEIPQAFIHKDSLYTLVEGPTRLEAETKAQSLGGNLVSINDQEENQFLRDSFNFFNPDTVPSDYQNQVDYAQSFWVGMEYVDQAWTWADGTTPESNGFSNWIPGDPDYLDREIYAKISPDATGRWANATNNDVTFSERPNVFYGIVEIPLANKGNEDIADTNNNDFPEEIFSGNTTEDPENYTLTTGNSEEISASQITSEFQMNSGSNETPPPLISGPGVAPSPETEPANPITTAPLATQPIFPGITGGAMIEIAPLGVERKVLNGREYLTNAADSLSGQANFNRALMGGNDFLEVTGGSNNFANGNNGEDYIILRGGHGRYLGGADNDRIEVFAADPGSHVNGNRGMDVVTGSVDGVIYRGGSENDTLQVSAGTVWGDKGADTFQAVAGAGVAVIQDYTVGEDFVQGIAGGSFTLTDQGLSYGVGNDQMLLLLNIKDASQVSMI